MEVDNIAQFIIFYISFLFLLIATTSFLPISMIMGISEEDITVLTENVVLPPEPTIIDYVIFPFIFVYSTISKFLLLLKISSMHQFLTIIITSLSFGLIWKIMKLIRG